MSIPEKYIRACAKCNNIKFSFHALQRMGERKIRDYKVLDCIQNGQYIEEQDHGDDIKVLFQSIEGEKGFYTVVATSTPPLVVSVCLFDEDVWEEVKGIMKRRKNK